MVLSKETAQEIDSVCAKIEYHSVLYDEWGLSTIDPRGDRVAVSLYGPPGTGKTMCAEALAHRFGKPILEVDYADVESKYVGETPKNIRAAFKRAQECGALLFFDEADSILGKRMTNVTQSADHSVNVSRAVMLRQMDLFSGIVVFATNLARNYGPAFVRRIPYHIYMPHHRPEPPEHRAYEQNAVRPHNGLDQGATQKVQPVLHLPSEACRHQYAVHPRRQTKPREDGRDGPGRPSRWPRHSSFGHPPCTSRRLRALSVTRRATIVRTAAHARPAANTGAGLESSR